MRSKAELLVPAGGTQQFIAAVENGADAVYVGGPMYSARASARNFDREELTAAVDYAHKRDVRVHVAMNTLMREDELAEALAYAEFLYTTGVDALIVQDLGLAGLIHSRLPDFPLHLSTQATVHDWRSVKAAQELGFSRVVLSRELSLKDLREIAGKTDIELEIFVHGAICICYSGQCQLSRYFGGRSGNRGQCAQPCRLPYETFDDTGNMVNTFRSPLSPQDLSYLNHLGELIRLGIASFKIEGRMKSPEYVAAVTAVYRKYIDEFYRSGRVQLADADRSELMQIYSRGCFTDDYLKGCPGPSMMSGDIPKHQGIRIGRVVRRVNGNLIDIELNGDLAPGDGIEIHSRRIVGNIVTYYREMKKSVVRIGDIRGKVEPEEAVFRTSSKEQLKRLRATFENVSYNGGKFVRKLPVTMTMTFEHGFTRLNAAAYSEAAEEITGNGLVSAQAERGPFDAEENPMKRERFIKQLKKSGGTPFEVERIIFGDGLVPAIKVSEINAMRREVLTRLERQLVLRRELPTVEKTSAGFKRNGLKENDFKGISQSTPERIELYFYDLKSFHGFKFPEELKNADCPVAALLPAAGLVRHMQQRNQLDVWEKTDFDLIIPYISNVTKGKESEIIESHLDDIVEICMKSGIYTGTLGWISPFVSRGITVYGDFGLNVFNQPALEAVRGLGAAGAVTSLEAMNEVAGAFPLMTMQYRPKGFYLRGKSRIPLEIRDRCWSSQTILLPGGSAGQISWRDALRLNNHSKEIDFIKVKRFYIK